MSEFGNDLIFFNDDIIYKGKQIKAIDYPELDWNTDICNCSPVLQLALGITNLTANPELLQICEFSRKIGIIPNITCHGKDEVSDEYLKALCELCGNISTSRYKPYDNTYNFIHRLHTIDNNVQLNMHVLMAEEEYETIMQALHDIVEDPRLSCLYSLIFIFLKEKGRGGVYHQVSDEHLAEIMSFAIEHNIQFGFDVCGTKRFEKFVKNYKGQTKYFPENFDLCDSGRFSCYVNTLGEYCPCSFIENCGMWNRGIDMFKIHNFIDDIWLGEKSELYRSLIIGKKCKCLYFDV